MSTNDPSRLASNAPRGQLETVMMLLEKRPLLEVRNIYGGTVLGSAIWAAFHEPRPQHVAIIEALVKAGARTTAVDYPTGVEPIDRLLERYGARSEAAQLANEADEPQRAHRDGTDGDGG